MGFDIKLEKAQEIDITKDLAHQAAVAQVVKAAFWLYAVCIIVKDIRLQMALTIFAK